MRYFFNFLLLVFILFGFMGCATNGYEIINQISKSNKTQNKIPVVISNFEPQVPYNSRYVADKIAALTRAALIENGNFIVFDIINSDAFIISPDLLEFGRQTTTNRAFFGLLAESTTKTSFAKISLNLINEKSGEIFYTSIALAKAWLNNKEILGFGSSVDDEFLLDERAISLAIKQAVTQLANDLNNKNSAYNK